MRGISVMEPANPSACACIYIYFCIYYYREVSRMDTAKVFTTGGSQAVRLPKSCRFTDDEVLVNRIGSIVILMPKDDPWKSMVDSLPHFTEDFLADGVEALPVQERDCL